MVPFGESLNRRRRFIVNPGYGLPG
jgi:hypothetical protein